MYRLKIKTTVSCDAGILTLDRHLVFETKKEVLEEIERFRDQLKEDGCVILLWKHSYEQKNF